MFSSEAEKLEKIIENNLCYIACEVYGRDYPVVDHMTNQIPGIEKRKLQRRWVLDGLKNREVSHT